MKHFKGLLSVLLLIATVSFVACSSGTGGNQNPPVTYIGTKAPTEAKVVGDIVFNDGSSMPYTAFAALGDEAKNTKKTSAIALIFYKGTGLNSGDDTTTSRTLGVGLKHNRNGLEWCIIPANAYSKNITTIQCPVSGSTTGVLTYTGSDRNGSDNLAQIGTFLSSNSSTDDTATATKYPAFYFGKNYKDQKIGSETESRIPADSEFATGWYLPSSAELLKIYACRADTTNGFNIDEASNALDGDKFEDSYYWSSSQSATTVEYAYKLNFANGVLNGDGKSIDWNDPQVCCIRAFN